MTFAWADNRPLGGQDLPAVPDAVVQPDQESVTAISSANRQEYRIDDEALFPLLNDLIIPAIDGA